jgi:hypothetical protein
MSLTLLYIVIARSVSDVPAHRSAVLWHAGVAISKRDSFASLGMTHGPHGSLKNVRTKPQFLFSHRWIPMDTDKT